MRWPTAWRRGGALAAVAALAAPAAAAADDCLPLAAGTGGLPVVSGALPSVDAVLGRPVGVREPAPETVARTLPADVALRDRRETFDLAWLYAVRGGRIYAKPGRAGLGAAGEVWRRLELPPCLDGRVAELTADGRQVTALTHDRRVVSLDRGEAGPAVERWTTRYGAPFWLGPGARLWRDVRDWQTSELTLADDGTFTDGGGRTHPVGEGFPGYTGLTHLYALRGDGTTITFLDPWLPADESREVCGPHRGRLRLAGLAAGGSTLLVAGRDGSLHSRFYDFDVGGGNPVVYRYAFDRAAAPPRAVLLPAPAWVRQPAPPGEVTDRLTVVKTGRGSAARLLRVEGRDRRGISGRWEKPVDPAAPWTFVATGEPLRGRPLPLRRPHLARAPGLAYRGAVAGASLVLRGLDAACSPATLTVSLPGTPPLDVRLHTADGLRQLPRGADIDDEPREMEGALEVPPASWSVAHGRLRDWLRRHLGPRRIVPTTVTATRSRVRLGGPCWVLVGPGGPGRPSLEPAAPAGRLLGQLGRGRLDRC